MPITAGAVAKLKKQNTKLKSAVKTAKHALAKVSTVAKGTGMHRTHKRKGGLVNSLSYFH